MRHMSWTFLCSVVWGERWLCVLLLFLELLIITFLISFRNHENKTKIILNRNE
jgi:hypothetical protein